MNILYVENHPVSAENVVRQFLSQHRVTVVPSISSAHKAISDGSFDLLLVDYDLDDGKGAELVQSLRSSRHSIVIIAVSARSEGNDALVKAGANAVCSKMEFDAIQGVIDTVMKTCEEREHLR
jgi:DNA-binding response OmpR family regulator